MNETLMLHEETKKQTEHLRMIRNWIAAIGLMIVVLPIVGLFTYLIMVGFTLNAIF